MYCTLSSTVCTCKPCQKEQATSVVTDFFSWGHDLFAHACEATPLTIAGRTSLTVSSSSSAASRMRSCHLPCVPFHFLELRIQLHTHPLRTAADIRNLRVLSSLGTPHALFNSCLKNIIQLDACLFRPCVYGPLLLRFRFEFVTVLPIVHLAMKGRLVLPGSVHLPLFLLYRCNFDCDYYHQDAFFLSPTSLLTRLLP